jgi:hypothetical protein
VLREAPARRETPTIPTTAIAIRIPMLILFITVSILLRPPLPDLKVNPQGVLSKEGNSASSPQESVFYYFQPLLVFLPTCCVAKLPP